MKTHILRSLELFKGTVLPVLAVESICWPWGPDTWQGAGHALSPFALSAGPLSSGDGPCTGLLSSGIPVIFQPRVQSDHPADSDIVLFLNNSAYVRRLKFTFRNSLLSGSSFTSRSLSWCTRGLEKNFQIRDRMREERLLEWETLLE